MLTAKDKRRLRQVAHHLQPIVIIAERGLTEGLLDETRRALSEHELIKTRINVDDRTVRKELGVALAASCEADVVQVVGKVWVLYRPNPDAEPSLSNVARYS